MTLTNDQIMLAAKLCKIVRLASMPEMDRIAMKLNCEPTYDEIKTAQYWAKAFEVAGRGGMDHFRLAADLYKETGGR